MTGPRFALVPVAGHELHVTEWGTPGAPGLVMWHGLARTGRDFDELAAALSDRFHVLCPDTIGRGLSTWPTDPGRAYSLASYADLATGLLDHYDMARAGWIGTSMGGLIGMWLAAGPRAARLDWLVVNDIGPEIPQAAIDRIVAYVGDPPDFATLGAAEGWLRETYAPFGPASDAFWRRMARTSVRRRGDGRLTLHYDPAITLQFTAARHELTSWDRFARIDVPMQLIAGARSDLLPPPLIARMRREMPRMGVEIVAGIGHAPTLSRPEDIAMVEVILDRLTAR